MTPHEIISLRIAELTLAVKTLHPSISSLLSTIHRDLQSDPDVVAILAPAERASIVAALMFKTTQTITTSILSGSKGKSAKKMGVEDV